MADMIRVADVSKITGLGTQQVRVHARRGDIPSAVQYTHKGGWYFNETIIRQWKRNRGVGPCQSIKEVKFGGLNFNGMDAKLEDQVNQLLSAKPSNMNEN